MYTQYEKDYEVIIGEFLRSTRQELGFTIAQMQNLVDVSKKTWIEMEKGERNIKLHLIFWWAFSMGLSPYHYMAQTDYSKPLKLNKYKNLDQIKWCLLINRLAKKDLKQLAQMIQDVTGYSFSVPLENMYMTYAQRNTMYQYVHSQDFYDNSGSVILDHLESSGKTQVTLASELGMSERNLRRIIYGLHQCNNVYFPRFYELTGQPPLKSIKNKTHFKLRNLIEERVDLIADLFKNTSKKQLNAIYKDAQQLENDPKWMQWFS
ncbi:helix-turn-helix domain-containing protein [Gynuella sunshinyii]|uniref:Uncharacterized protein n=1 Tax=Gynuella sunshinyii YC6258 TaxID=1445510 RepID=A0A0C5VDJ0_9GAMM|nr:helix-turn-helix transcriptional regulator [Gynuella sunshinyii]AJQ97400.1 hypothetical Protein YC6258_05370 [Gynuella sunshinyii YC6258]